MFVAVLAAGCGSTSEPAADDQDVGTDGPSSQHETDATLLTTQAKKCITEGAACQVACFAKLPLADMRQLVAGCEGDVNACMTNPQNARDCIEEAIRACVQEARDQLAEQDLSGLQEDVGECQTTCSQTASACVDDLGGGLPAEVLQCANSAVEDFQTCVTALDECDYQALVDAIECDDDAYDAMSACLADALTQHSPTAAQACIDQMMTDCNVAALQEDPCVTDLADCASDAHDAFTNCLP
jgi:hypothetical protein